MRRKKTKCSWENNCIKSTPNDADLIGIPIRINVGRRAEEGIVEFSLRRGGEKEEIPVSEIAQKVKDEFAYQGL